MTTSTDDQLRSHLRTLARTQTKPAEEIEQDVLHRVARRRRHRRQGVALGGTAVLALLASATVLLAGGEDSDTGTDVKAFEKERAASSPGNAPVQQLVNMVEIQRFHPDPTERVTIEFDAPLPNDAVTQVDDTTEVDAPGIAFTTQGDTPSFLICGDQHFGSEPSTLTHVTVLVPASWFQQAEDAKNMPIVFPDDTTGAVAKVIVCGPHEGYVQVAIMAAQSDDVEVSVTADRTRVIVDIGPR